MLPAGGAKAGQRLGERGLALVYGGAQVGLMGVLADAARRPEPP